MGLDSGTKIGVFVVEFANYGVRKVLKCRVRKGFYRRRKKGGEVDKILLDKEAPFCKEFFRVKTEEPSNCLVGMMWIGSRNSIYFLFYSKYMNFNI